MASLTLITDPTAEPATLAEAKLHLRVDHDEEDAHIGALISAARIHVENVCSRALVNQTWLLALDGFPCEIRPPRPPLVSVTTLQYVDAGGTTRTASTSTYSVDAYSEPGRIVPAYGTSWPTTRNQINSVLVTYVAGYGAGTSAEVPQAIRQAILLLVGHWYANREAVGSVGRELALAVDALLAPYVNRYPIDQ